MRKYNSEGRSRGRGFSGGRPSDRQMHVAVCSNCGKNCKVPFRPTNGKPIYCSDCFEKMERRDDGNRHDDRRPRSMDFGGRERTSDMSAQRRIEDRGIKNLTAKIEDLNGKLDDIIDLLSQKKDIKEKSSQER